MLPAGIPTGIPAGYLCGPAPLLSSRRFRVGLGPSLRSYSITLSGDPSSLVLKPRHLPCITQETPEQTEARALDALGMHVAVHRSDLTYYVKQPRTSSTNKLKSSDMIR
jgi:hypothetical protein